MRLIFSVVIFDYGMMKSYFRYIVWDVIIYLCHNFNNGVSKPLLNVGHGRVISVIILYESVYLSVY